MPVSLDSINEKIEYLLGRVKQDPLSQASSELDGYLSGLRDADAITVSRRAGGLEKSAWIV